ncbi:MAG: hypothetical protein ABT940_07965 [Alphaproteobacteria bacterium]
MLERLVKIGSGLWTTVTTVVRDGPSVVTSYVHPSGTRDFMVYAAGKGPILVELHGNPFSPPDAMGVEAILRTMGGAVGGCRTLAFTIDPEQAPHPEFRVVLAFQAPVNLDGRSLCGGMIPPTVPDRDRLALLAVFCNGTNLLAEVRGRVGTASGPGDPRFQQMLAQVTRSLFV